MPIRNENTPNVVIKDSNVRFWAGSILYGIGFLTAVAAMFFNFFPEIAGDGDMPTRVIAFINAVTSLFASAFGLAVSTPNVPRKF